MNQRVLVDTGPLEAIFSEMDAHHRACVEQLKTLARPLLTCWPVLTEAAWLLRGRPPAIHALLNELQNGFLELLPMDSQAAAAIDGHMRRYASSGPRLADASLVYLAEREKIHTVFTLDRRDFKIVRVQGNRRLKLLPE